MATYPTLRLNLEDQLFSFDILGACRISFRGSLEQLCQRPEQEFEFQHGVCFRVTGWNRSGRVIRQETGRHALEIGRDTGTEQRARHPGK